MKLYPAPSESFVTVLQQEIRRARHHKSCWLVQSVWRKALIVHLWKRDAHATNQFGRFFSRRLLLLWHKGAVLPGVPWDGNVILFIQTHEFTQHTLFLPICFPSNTWRCQVSQGVQCDWIVARWEIPNLFSCELWRLRTTDMCTQTCCSTGSPGATSGPQVSSVRST